MFVNRWGRNHNVVYDWLNNWLNNWNGLNRYAGHNRSLWNDDGVRDRCDDVIGRIQSALGLGVVSDLLSAIEFRSRVHTGQNLLVENGAQRTDERAVRVVGDSIIDSRVANGVDLAFVASVPEKN